MSSIGFCGANGSGCDHASHRAIEGVLTYLNAFLLLDYARSVVNEHRGWGVIVLLVISIIVFWYLRRECERCDRASTNAGDAITPSRSIVARNVPPSPGELFTSFARPHKAHHPAEPILPIIDDRA
ncbi:MAG: hypothetical protein M0R66_06725 [Candidatus Omnitrophica bacterium]|jgi:hypothetical protein|nr:hypothetical protein [Candidatus Omnitrophota bacterium]